MQFGKVDNISGIDFTLPPDAPENKNIIKQRKDKDTEIYIGCAKWNKTDLKNFYPKGNKDELGYYSTQFNSIELNATFYGTPTKDQVELWKSKTPPDFKFFPKITNSISHFRRLIEVKSLTDQYCDAICLFEEKLGSVFLQLHDNFKPKDFSRLENFIQSFPKNIPLAVEVRNTEWFAEKDSADQYFKLLEDNNVANIIVDTAGRRDLLHMRLTNSTAFVRYVGANDISDYKRLDDWFERIKEWKKEGLNNLYFFVHQNIEKASPLLSAYLIKKLNSELGTNLHFPITLSENSMGF